jgi:hypothetical protein
VTLVAAINKKATSPLAPSHSSTPSLPTPNSGPSTVVSGSKEKKHILDEYVSKFGSGYQESIITKKKGKHNQKELFPSSPSSWQCMKPSTNKYYQVKELTIYNIITIVIKEYVAFSKSELSSIHLLNTNLVEMIPKLQQWLQIDFSLLWEPRLNYKSQTKIDPHWVSMANAAMAHFGLDPGRFIWWMGGEYTGQYQDAYSTLAAVWGHVLANDYAHMKWILLDSCPAPLNFEEPLSNKIKMIKRGKSKSYTNLVLKTMNKEDGYSHLIPLDEIMCRFSPYCRHTTQTSSWCGWVVDQHFK